nr:MAG TPA: hypothetical protein [Bacteriophage sp.]
MWLKFAPAKSTESLEKQRKTRSFNDYGFNNFWCARRDLNPHKKPYKRCNFNMFFALS